MIKNKGLMTLGAAVLFAGIGGSPALAFNNFDAVNTAQIQTAQSDYVQEIKFKGHRSGFKGHRGGFKSHRGGFKGHHGGFKGKSFKKHHGFNKSFNNHGFHGGKFHKSNGFHKGFNNGFQRDNFKGGGGHIPYYYDQYGQKHYYKQGHHHDGKVPLHKDGLEHSKKVIIFK